MISEVDFISPCPVEECINKKTMYRWRHHNCGGHEKVTNQGNIYCLRCRNDALFIDWKFNCGAHDFKQASSQGFSHALYILSQLDKKNQLFIAQLNEKVSQQFIKQLTK